MNTYHYTLIAALFLLLTGCRSLPASPNTVFPQPVQPTATTETVSPTLPTPPVVKDTAPANTIDVDASPTATIVEDMPPKQQLATFVDYDVPFQSQAPYGVWDATHGEACEEASMIMVDAYFANASLGMHSMEQALLKMIDWETEQGYKIDVTAQETVAILKKYFNRSAELVVEPSVENIKQELRNGNLVIAPLAGRQLGNPYFTPPGPIYHMLVIRGFDDEAGEFITNDPGTKRGEAYRYKYLGFMNAIADWDHALAADGMTDAEIDQGRKVIVVVQP